MAVCIPMEKVGWGGKKKQSGCFPSHNTTQPRIVSYTTGLLFPINLPFLPIFHFSFLFCLLFILDSLSFRFVYKWCVMGCDVMCRILSWIHTHWTCLTKWTVILSIRYKILLFSHTTTLSLPSSFSTCYHPVFQIWHTHNPYNTIHTIYTCDAYTTIMVGVKIVVLWHRPYFN